ncbi:unnamed protein product [Brachionus calyciflorus]|uniref:Uncharacterized protein n=1 Tax=Brachionus calyciflorus TaxID=104777 RepID=A0A814F5F7_9BILA|nr:unnamed protein product [Brachionus calyciflorus]
MDDIYDIYLRNINRVCKEHYILASILKSYIKEYFQDQNIKDLLGEIVFEKHWNHKYALERLNKIYFHKLKICADVNNLPRAPSLDKKNIDKQKIPCYCETVSDSSQYHSVCSSLSHLNLFENPQKTSRKLFNNNEVLDNDDSDSDSDSSIISVIEVQKPEPEPLEQILTYEELIEELEREKSARIETQKHQLVTSSSQNRLKVNDLELRLKNETSAKDQFEKELKSLSSQLNEIEAEYSYGADQFDLLDNDYNNLKRRLSHD